MKCQSWWVWWLIDVLVVVDWWRTGSSSGSCVLQNEVHVRPADQAEDREERPDSHCGTVTFVGQRQGPSDLAGLFHLQHLQLSSPNATCPHGASRSGKPIFTGE